MRKTMKTMSIILSAIMSVSAMSSLAVTSFAYDNTDYENLKPQAITMDDDCINYATIPCKFITSGIEGRVSKFSVRFEYEYTVPAGSELAIANADKIISTDSKGMVTIAIDDTISSTSNTTMDVVIPKSINVNSLKISVGYEGIGASSNHKNFCNYNFSNYTGQLNKIEVSCDSGTKVWLGYWTSASIKVNDREVANGRG